jgi:hypothetical protein
MFWVDEKTQEAKRYILTRVAPARSRLERFSAISDIRLSSDVASLLLPTLLHSLYHNQTIN